MTQNQSDEAFMRNAIRLSRSGFPAPNPHVGCVVVADGGVIAFGFHDHTGGPHAEAVALQQAGARARGSTIYVTLEPCNHFGRTPPCAQALIEAGVRRVVIANPDPTEKAHGGAEALQRAGIDVAMGVLSEEAAAANRLFANSIHLKRPYVIAKSAVSLDGKIALPTGQSKWITGPESRAEAHRLRAECGAVLVGRKTVEVDDPQLTARFPGVVNQPLRIVLDPSARLDSHYRIFDDQAETWHVTGQVELSLLLERMTAARHIGLLVEGGGETIGRFLAADKIDELALFIAPIVIGEGKPWVSGLQLASLSEAQSFKFVEPKQVGRDIQLSATRNRS